MIENLKIIGETINASIPSTDKLFEENKLNKIGDNFYIAGNVSPEKVSNLILAFSALAQDILKQEIRLSKAYPEIITQLEDIN